MNLDDLRARAGITHLGKYRSSNPLWVRAQRDLGKQVTVPAIDRGAEKLLGDTSTEFVHERDNRSVTSPEWVAEGLYRYGCPIHATKSGVSTAGSDEFTVSGLGQCACRQDDGNATPARRPSVESPHSTTGAPTKSVEHSRSHNSRKGGSATSPSSLPDMLGHADANDYAANGRTSLSGNGSGDARYDGARRSWDADAYRDAFSATLSVAGDTTGGRKPYPLDEVVDRFIHKSHYAGAPYFTRNRFVLDRALRASKRIWTGARGFDPYLFGRRVQFGQSAPKTRLVWMASLTASIVGSAFSKRVHANLARRRPFLIGAKRVEQGALVEELKSRFRYIYTIDFSGYDASVPAFMIDDVFRVLRTHLDLDEVDRNVWDRYVSDFIHSRLITPSGEVFQKHKGIPSGSAFTSLVGSVCSLLLMNYVMIRLTGAALKSDRALILGDDVNFASDTEYNLGNLAKYAAELGFTISVEKSSVYDKVAISRRIEAGEVVPLVERGPHCLGHIWIHGWPHRPIREIAQRQLYTERHKRRNMAESMLRFFSYLTDAWESWELFVKAFPAEDSITSITRCLDAIGADEVEVEVVDLPGQLRYLAVVERDANENPVPIKGMELGVLSLVF